MNKCPICTNNIEKEKQEYCLTCAWEFEYFLDELSEEEKDRYSKRLQTFKAIYDNSIDNAKSKKLEKELQDKEVLFVELEKKLQDKEVLFKELEKKYSELKNQTNEKISVSQNNNIQKTVLTKKTIPFIWNTIALLFRILMILVAFVGIMIGTYYILGQYLACGESNFSPIDDATNTNILIGVVAFEGLLFLWITIRELKRLLIKKGLVPIDEKSPIFYFIGLWIGLIVEIPFELWNYFMKKVRK